jgi:hypothetical protein
MVDPHAQRRGELLRQWGDLVELAREVLSRPKDSVAWDCGLARLIPLADAFRAAAYDLAHVEPGRSFAFLVDEMKPSLHVVVESVKGVHNPAVAAAAIRLADERVRALLARLRRDAASAPGPGRAVPGAGAMAGFSHPQGAWPCVSSPIARQ